MSEKERDPEIARRRRRAEEELRDMPRTEEGPRVIPSSAHDRWTSYQTKEGQENDQGVKRVHLDEIKW